MIKLSEQSFFLDPSAMQWQLFFPGSLRWAHLSTALRRWLLQCQGRHGRHFQKQQVGLHSPHWSTLQTKLRSIYHMAEEESSSSSSAVSPWPFFVFLLFLLGLPSSSFFSFLLFLPFLVSSSSSYMSQAQVCVSCPWELFSSFPPPSCLHLSSLFSLKLQCRFLHCLLCFCPAEAMAATGCEN